MADLAELMKGVAAVLWVVVGLGALLVLRRVLVSRGASLSRFGVGPAGVTMEFAEAKIDQAVQAADESTRREIGQAAKRSVIDRLQAHAELLREARILWVDDHPENNTPIIELLRRFGATVETPRTNVEALALLRGSRYDVILSDVGRDNEGPKGGMMGVQLAEEVYRGWRQPVLLFTGRFDPASVPGLSAEERLDLVARLEHAVFARTNRMDEALHYIMDMIER